MYYAYIHADFKLYANSLLFRAKLKIAVSGCNMEMSQGRNTYLMILKNCQNNYTSFHNSVSSNFNLSGGSVVAPFKELFCENKELSQILSIVLDGANYRVVNSRDHRLNLKAFIVSIDKMEMSNSKVVHTVRYPLKTLNQASYNV